MGAVQLVQLAGAVVLLFARQHALLVGAKGVDDLGDSSLAAFSSNPAVAVRDRWRCQREGDQQSIPGRFDDASVMMLGDLWVDSLGADRP